MSFACFSTSKVMPCAYSGGLLLFLVTSLFFWESLWQRPGMLFSSTLPQLKSSGYFERALSYPRAKVCNGSPLAAENRTPSNATAAQDPSSKHWGVITTIFEFNVALDEFLTCWPSAHLVVVGDCKTRHQHWREMEERLGRQRLVYLSPQDQAMLPYRILEHTPWNHFGRKSIGFMYAIRHGAEMIFDFDDDNHVKCEKNAVFPRLVQEPEKYQVEQARTVHHVWNPYMWFGPENGRKDKSWEANLIWPRGFPLAFIKDPDTFLYAKDLPEPAAIPGSRVAVFQGLADHDPDVDAIYRMTRPLPVDFRSKKGLLGQGAPAGTFTPWNAQAVVFRQQAFWGMLLPITVTGRVSDIWRSHITTALMWVCGLQVAFTPSMVTQLRNPHYYMTDFREELDLYTKTDNLFATIGEWLGNFSATSLPEAYLSLLSRLAGHRDGFVRPLDFEMAKAWVGDLRESGYQWPELLPEKDRHIQVRVRKPRQVDERTAGGGDDKGKHKTP